MLHRLDALIARLSAARVDVLIGGNSGAAPVPALGLLLSQLLDLAAPADVEHPEAVSRLTTFADAYYDLAATPPNGLRVPLKHAWWRPDGPIELSDVAARLRCGLPVTRPALAPPLANPPDAWAHTTDVTVAGGNTVLLSPAAFGAQFTHTRCGELVSRRADTTWCIDGRSRGAQIVRASLPFLHDRQLRPRSAVEAADEALADALGFGTYRALLAGRADQQATLMFARERLASLRARLQEAEVVARELCARGCELAGLAEWIAEARGRLELPDARVSFHQATP